MNTRCTGMNMTALLLHTEEKKLCLYPHSDCVDKANAWLNQHGTVRLIRCETVKHRLDHQHFINTESSTSHDRSWLVGLR